MLPHARFVELFGAFLGVNHPDCCFYEYGSVYRGDHTSRSDVDGGIILEGGVVTDKRKLYDMACGLARCLSERRVTPQINVIDRQTAADGRFLSYGPDFTEHIKAASRVVSGPDLRSGLNGIDYRADVLRSAAFNLRTDRNYALLLVDLLQQDPLKARERVMAAVDHAIKYPKHLIWLQTRELIINGRERNSAIARLLGISTDMISDLGEKQTLFESDIVDAEEYIGYHAEALECTERLVRAYIERFPEPSNKERLLSQ